MLRTELGKHSPGFQGGRGGPVYGGLRGLGQMEPLGSH